MNHLPALIIIIPLCAALLSLVLTRIHTRLGQLAVFFAVTASLLCSARLLLDVVTIGPVHYHYGGYAMPYGIEFAVDSVSAVILVFVCLLGVLTCLFGFSFAERHDTMKTAGAYTMIGLLVVGMCGMTATGDVFNLYVFLEITSLSGYCLIALGGSRGVVASFRYLLIGTVAATFYLLGVGILYGRTGSLNMADMSAILDDPSHGDAMLIAMCLFIAAFGIKMSLFPFHAWQPSAYSHAETGTRPLIAGAMGKIPAYAMFRFLYCIYGTDFAYFRQFLIVIAVFSCFGMIYGSVRAMAQDDTRKLLAYSSIAQMGYISLGFAVGTPLALAGAFLHMIGHGFMKSGLFFCIGAFRYRFGAVQLDALGRIYKKMPITSGLLVLAALSMIGIPPAVGFFSKWYLATAAASVGEYILVAVLVVSSLLNAVYFFRLIEKVFIQEEQDPREVVHVRRGELPLNMLIPIVVCFLAILLLGVFNVKVIDILLLTTEGVGL